jgi:hypothetical protein
LVFFDVALSLILVDDRPPAGVFVVESTKGAVRIDVEVRNGTNVAGRQLIFVDLELPSIGAPLQMHSCKYDCIAIVYIKAEEQGG